MTARAFAPASARRALVVEAADQKAVCVLTGTAGVESVVTITQSGDDATKVVDDLKVSPAQARLPHPRVRRHQRLHVHRTPLQPARQGPRRPHRREPPWAASTAWPPPPTAAPWSRASRSFRRRSIIGRACVIHELEDDLGKGDRRDGTQANLQTTGNAGARLACGVRSSSRVAAPSNAVHILMDAKVNREP